LSFFEFVLVLASVIYALAIAQLLSGASRVSQSDLEQKFYLPHAAWISILFLGPLITWWSLWALRDIEWTFAAFFLIIMQPVVVYYACSLIAPAALPNSVRTLEEHFSRIRRPLMVTQFIGLALTSTDGVILLGESFWHPGRYFHLVVVSALLFGFLVDSRKSRAAVALLVLSAMILLIVVRFWTPAG
jgi:hypothetical protein